MRFFDQRGNLVAFCFPLCTFQDTLFDPEINDLSYILSETSEGVLFQVLPFPFMLDHRALPNSESMRFLYSHKDSQGGYTYNDNKCSNSCPSLNTYVLEAFHILSLRHQL